MAGPTEAPRAAGDPAAARIEARKTVQRDRVQRTGGSFQAIDTVSVTQAKRDNASFPASFYVRLAMFGSEESAR
jgi:hypothetical protein